MKVVCKIGSRNFWGSKVKSFYCLLENPSKKEFSISKRKGDNFYRFFLKEKNVDILVSLLEKRRRLNQNEKP